IILNADRVNIADIPAFLTEGITSPLVVFANSNNQTTITNTATGEAQNRQQILYVTSPGSQQRTEALTLQSAEGNRFYPAHSGTAIAYSISNGKRGLDSWKSTPVQGTTGYARLWTTTSIRRRGIASEPGSRPAGEHLAVRQE